MDSLQLPNIEEILSDDEAKQVKDMLSNPAVQKYFRVLLKTSAMDIADNEAETAEQEKKLMARFNKFKGVQYVCTFIINNFGKKE